MYQGQKFGKCGYCVLKKESERQSPGIQLPWSVGRASQVVLMVKNQSVNAGDYKKCGFHPWVGKIPLRKSMANPLQYSCLENPMDRGAWRATVHEVAKCQTWLSVHAHTHTQMISDTDNLFLYLCVSSLEKLYSDSLSYFNWVHWVFSFLLLSCVSSLYQLMTYFINLIIWMNVC